jgi:hypothetical protein
MDVAAGIPQSAASIGVISMAQERFQRRFDILKALYGVWSEENNQYITEFLHAFDQGDLTAIARLMTVRRTVNRKSDALRKWIEKWEKQSFSHGLVHVKTMR